MADSWKTSLTHTYSKSIRLVTKASQLLPYVASILTQLFTAESGSAALPRLKGRVTSHRKILLFLVLWEVGGEKGLGSLVIADRRILGGDSEVSQQVLWPKKNPNIFYITIWKALQIGRWQSSSLLWGFGWLVLRFFLFFFFNELRKEKSLFLTGFQPSLPI